MDSTAGSATDSEPGGADSEPGAAGSETGDTGSETGAADSEPGISDSEPGATDTVPPDSGTDTETADTESVTDSLFPMTFDFEGSQDGFQVGTRPGWVWNAATGALDLDTAFSISPDWATVELYASYGIWPGGIDWRGATAVDFRVRVERASGGYFRVYIQSIERESETMETWLWYPTDFALTPDGAWHTFTLDLTASGAPLNLAEVTKLGVQVHAPEDAVDADPSDTDVQIAPPAEVKLSLDSVTVRGVNPSQ